MLDQRPGAASSACFFLLYVAGAALSLPGAVILTLAAGAIFGLWLGTLIVSFASTIGASLAFLSSRFVLRDWVKARFGKRIAAIDRGIASEGALYLLTMRLIPAFPFFLVNLAMGLTTMRLPTFALVSQVGMLPGTIDLRERRHPARRDREHQRHRLARPDRLVRPARAVPACSPSGSSGWSSGAASIAAIAGRAASTAT